ncbi:hypothetical protein U879_16020 [Defluviimonas sp. 20V17]|uniref:DUF2062 domain-containing protein n=1 Tax=Allgaiera indica TaxID=765699 RepID=A0A1H2XMB3_9RHOB|nr:DUF2062 domain-containing protein [Allgaiera indica]KDB02700.1 hypothetical protein U879_16020 [Defluviimonas sp. 20V17]SDW93429.1 hypothetical protein SAMN05444006_10864 [Allgaiera indica]
MVFKRRTKQSFGQRLIAAIYPRGGYLRAIWYVIHRIRRLPDQPHRIARGIAAGVFISFTPFFGFHFVIAAGLAWLMGGNMVAALLATFVGNPITFPFIMTLSVELGSHLLGKRGGIPLRQIVDSFARASVELWNNFTALFLDHSAHWSSLILFFHHVFWPYLIGGILPGLAAALTGYYLSLPLITAYQKRRKKKIRERIEKQREQRARAAAEAARKPHTQPSE